MTLLIFRDTLIQHYFSALIVHFSTLFRMTLQIFGDALIQHYFSALLVNISTLFFITLLIFRNVLFPHYFSVLKEHFFTNFARKSKHSKYTNSLLFRASVKNSYVQLWKCLYHLSEVPKNINDSNVDVAF